jgi:hypothetical protein
LNLPAETQLQAVSCWSPVACTVVGSNGEAPYLWGASPLVERWNGKRWSRQQAPVAGAAALYGVSCSSATVCTAVGSHIATNGTPLLAMRWNGRTWSVQQTPEPPPGWAGRLSSVSCPSPTACTAVGELGRLVDLHAPVVWRWDGRRWKAYPPTELPPSFAFGRVSCASAASCVALGSPASRWNGKRWLTQSLVADNGVSCPTPTTCTVVGWYRNAAGDELTLVERWNASR